MKYESSPFPFAETLEGYERIVAGGGDRLLTQVENEGNHRRWMDRTFVYYRFTGLILGFIVAMTTVLGGILLAFTDHSAAGLTILISALVALAGIFVLNQYAPARRARREEDTQ